MDKFVRCGVVLSWLLLCCTPALAGNASLSPDMKPLTAGTTLPDITFSGPVTTAEAKALGAASESGFKLTGIKADAVVLVVFSMYCPYCQKDAPELKKMHELIASRGLAGKLALVGLGAGNSAYEVNIFREKFGLSFPLIPDPDFAAYKILGQVGTPFYYILKRKGNGFTIVDTQLGCMVSPEAFLDSIQAKAGLKKGK